MPPRTQLKSCRPRARPWISRNCSAWCRTAAPPTSATQSKHWTRWLRPEHRCVVPFNSFSEFNKAEGGDIWFALEETCPLACFAGTWTNWTSVRKVKEGETVNDLYAFITDRAERRGRPSTRRRCR